MASKGPIFIASEVAARLISARDAGELDKCLRFDWDAKERENVSYFNFIYIDEQGNRGPLQLRLLNERICGKSKFEAAGVTKAQFTFQKWARQISAGSPPPESEASPISVIMEILDEYFFSGVEERLARGTELKKRLDAAAKTGKVREVWEEIKAEFFPSGEVPPGSFYLAADPKIKRLVTEDLRLPAQVVCFMRSTTLRRAVQHETKEGSTIENPLTRIALPNQDKTIVLIPKLLDYKKPFLNGDKRDFEPLTTPSGEVVTLDNIDTVIKSGSVLMAGHCTVSACNSSAGFSMPLRLTQGLIDTSCGKELAVEDLISGLDLDGVNFAPKSAAAALPNEGTSAAPKAEAETTEEDLDEMLGSL